MKIADRVLGISPEITDIGSANYQIYRSSLKWIAVGLSSIAIGQVADTAGFENGSDISMGGAVVMWIGGAVMSVEVPKIRVPEE